jgi:hypothetical protein
VTIYIKIYIAFLLLALLSYIAARRKEQHAKWIILYLGLCLATTVAAIVVLRLGWKYNTPIFHLFTLLEYTVLSLLFYNVLSSERLKRVVLVSVPVFIVTAAAFSLFVQKYDTDNNSYVIIIESILIILWSMFFLREVLLLQQVTSLQGFPLFWASVGILFYFTGNLIIEGMMNYLYRHSMEDALRAYHFGYVFKYLMFLMFTIGAFCRPAPRRHWRQTDKFDPDGTQL